MLNEKTAHEDKFIPDLPQILKNYLFFKKKVQRNLNFSHTL